MTADEIRASVDLIAPEIGGNETLGARFVDKVDVRDGACWIWQGSRNDRGYGKVLLNNPRLIYAHRLAHLALVGPIPSGAEIDHLCRNPPCVNPEHLEAVSHTTNVRRGESVAASRARALARTHCRRGHEMTDQNKVLRVNGTYDCRTCRRIRKQRQRVAA